jgi:hypothetical protein
VIWVLIERDDLDQAEDVLEQWADPLTSRAVDAVRFLIARGRLRGRAGPPAGGAR